MKVKGRDKGAKSYERRAVMTLGGAKTSDVSDRKILVYEETFIIAYNRLVKKSLKEGGNKLLALSITNINFIPGSFSPLPDPLTKKNVDLAFNVTFKCKYNYCNDDNPALFKSAARTRKLDAEMEWDKGDASEFDTGEFTSRRLADALFSADALLKLITRRCPNPAGDSFQL